MKKNVFNAIFIVIALVLIISQINCTGKEEKKEMSQTEMVALGKYLVTTAGCDDCHTPKIFTPTGPVFDTTKRFSGFPEGESLPAYDVKYAAPGNWYAAEKHLAAWVGPWGISYASNLTPDNATGIGALTEEMFIKTLREGKFMGVGRPLLPPMPWQVIGMKTDQDLKAMYAYFKSLKPIQNKVPEPTPPDKMKEMLTGK
jgi:hypothetical protein